MNKNFNLENAKSIIAEASGVPVNTTFGSITKPIDLLLEVIDMSADLIALIHEETELKKHHRAYLHVHEELEDCADQMAERMQEIFDETTDCVIKLMKDVHETFRVRKQEAAEDDADTVTGTAVTPLASLRAPTEHGVFEITNNSKSRCRHPRR